MKVIIQIPCWNEEKCLSVALSELPKNIAGVDIIETLVIDDGSTDKTIEVAQRCGVEHIVKLGRHKGLARAFKVGLEESLKLGADIIINTDADNQYNAADIAKLVKPILEENADMVVGNRRVESIAHFSWLKKRLQKLGSWAVRKLSGIEVLDATSGFRAFSREAALKMNIISDYTYTLETLIQAGQKQLKIEFVDVRVNRVLRKSRLMPNIPVYLFKSAVTMFRIFVFYRPLRVFAFLGSLSSSLGIFLGLRYLYFQLLVDTNEEHLASLFLCATFLIIGFFLFMMGVLGDQIGVNRKLLEDALLRVRKIELED